MAKVCQLLAILIFGVSACTSQAAACSGVPKHAQVSVDDLVGNAQGIYRVSLQAAMSLNSSDARSLEPAKNLQSTIQQVRIDSQRSVLYSFDVLETFKGNEVTRLEIILPLRAIDPNYRDFDAHTNGAFWTDVSIGRAQVSSDCAITASFNFGDQYLIVMTDRPTIKSFERIVSPNDKLLNFVRDRRTID